MRQLAPAGRTSRAQIRPDSLATPEYTSTSSLAVIGMPSSRSSSKSSMTPSLVTLGGPSCVEMNDT